MGVEPTRDVYSPILDLKSRRPTGTSTLPLMPNSLILLELPDQLLERGRGQAVVEGPDLRAAEDEEKGREDDDRGRGDLERCEFSHESLLKVPIIAISFSLPLRHRYSAGSYGRR